METSIVHESHVMYEVHKQIGTGCGVSLLRVATRFLLLGIPVYAHRASTLHYTQGRFASRTFHLDPTARPAKLQVAFSSVIKVIDDGIIIIATAGGMAPGHRHSRGGCLGL